MAGAFDDGKLAVIDQFGGWPSGQFKRTGRVGVSLDDQCRQVEGLQVPSEVGVEEAALAGEEHRQGVEAICCRVQTPRSSAIGQPGPKYSLFEVRAIQAPMSARMARRASSKIARSTPPGLSSVRMIAGRVGALSTIPATRAAPWRVR